MRQLYTRWGLELKNDPDRAEQGDVLRDYPRPQMARSDWTCLNGYWDYAITQNPGNPTSDPGSIPELICENSQKMLAYCPAHWDGRILVPFAPESALSGVGRQLQPAELLWYHRTFHLGSDWSLQHRKVLPAFLSDETASTRRQCSLLLHFGAVDQTCMVYVNGNCAARHVGGYLSFTADITDYVHEGENNLLVLVQDLSDTSYHARGKQKLARGGMFYTATSGIWQTVWMETVPRHYISRLEINPDSDTGLVSFTVRTKCAHVEDNTILPVTIAIRKACRYAQDLPETKSTALPSEKPAALTKTVPDSAVSEGICGLDDKAFAVNKGTLPPGPSYDKTGERIIQSADAAEGDVTQGDDHPIIAAGSGFSDEPVVIRIPRSETHHWSPEEPWLYQADIILENAGLPDHVKTYFALRSISLERDAKGVLRVCLNHEPYFQKGVLDQGYWPDGLLTAPSDEAMIFDIQEAKRTGFNMIRKHIKVEPERWYYHCDRLGMLVWQDMVNGGEEMKQWFVTYLATGISLLQLTVPDTWHHLLSRTNEEGREEFEEDLQGEIAQLSSHPCISTWVIFNEGWGQFDTNRLTNMVRNLDSTRLIDQASGWFDQHGGDFRSVHNYFFPFRNHRERKRAYVLSEFGGKTLRCEGHCTQDVQDESYGYGAMEDTAALNQAYQQLDAKVMQLENGGLCGSVYTQWTDIEDEINGIYTYDRQVRKITPSKEP